MYFARILFSTKAEPLYHLGPVPCEVTSSATGQWIAWRGYNHGGWEIEPAIIS